MAEKGDEGAAGGGPVTAAAGTDSTEAGASAPMEAEEAAPLPPFSMALLVLVTDAHREHGLRHNDYHRYRFVPPWGTVPPPCPSLARIRNNHPSTYCSKRLHRLRKSLKFTNGKRHFSKKELTVEKLTDQKLLEIPLMLAERAWSYAMQLKQETAEDDRKKFHMVSRLRKAKVHANELNQLVKDCPRSDARLELEAAAYAAWMSGNLDFELQKWDDAMKSYSEAKMIYEKLASASTEEHKPVYTLRLEGIDANIRYCVYSTGGSTDLNDLVQMTSQLAGEANELLASKLDMVLEKTRQREAETLTEITWQDRTVPVKNEKLRVCILRINAKEQELKQCEDNKERMDCYDALFIEYADAASVIGSDTQEQQKAMAAGKTSAEQSEQDLAVLDFLGAYIAHLRLARTLDRTQLLIDNAREALSSPNPKTASKPEDLVRLYSSMAQVLQELIEVPILRDDLDFVKLAEARQLLYKAWRFDSGIWLTQVCFYIAKVHAGANKTREAWALFDRCHQHARIAQSQLSECAGASAEAYLRDLSTLTAALRTERVAIRARACIETEDADQPSSDAADVPLSERLDVYLDDTEAIKKSKLVSFPPDFLVVPCKPLFFDLARNYVEFPNLEERRKVKSTGTMGAVSGMFSGAVKGLSSFWGR